MKNKFYLFLIITFCSFNFSIAQVGIGTAAPDSQLDIRSSSVASPTNTDGILIPRVSTLTAAGSMTAAQNGMLVYLTTLYSGNDPGFYYWDNSVPAWVGITSAKNDKDWYKVGTTTAPTAITDNMFHTGNVGIGTSTPANVLDIKGNNNWDTSTGEGDVRIGDPTYRFKIGVANSGAGAGDIRLTAQGGTNRIFLGNSSNTTLTTIDGANNRVGIKNNITPASVLDVNGDLALREGTAITVAAGANTITLTGEYSHYRLTGAVGAFSLSTITGGNDGQLLTLINATGQIMTITNNNVANGILTGTGADLVSTGTANSSISLIYNSTLARWTITGSSGMVNTNSWNINGNTASATDFIGTTNAQPFRVYCNNIERIRINTTDGEIVTGALTSPYVGDLFNGVSTATLPFALNGYSSQNGSGVWGETLAASSSAFSSVQGYYGGTGVGAAVFGNYAGTNTSNTRSGVTGMIASTSTSNGGAAVTGNHQASSGNQHMGVLGQYNGAAFGMGVVGIGFGGSVPTGNLDIGVVGWRTNNANYSGYFNGNHVIANGTKSASVGTSKGNQLLYVTETPEVWFEDLGGGQLVNGATHISLDDMYLETIFVDNTHPMRIFLQEEGESNGLIVIKDADNKGFTVKEKNNGTSNISFSYRIMAKRLHFQDHRFGNDPVWGGGDTRKYNQYATPPPVDYNENVRFQAEQKKNYKPTPMPEGFIDYMTLQKQAQQIETKKTEKKQ